MKLATVNNVLLTLIILVNAYTLLVPFWPQATYSWQSHHGQQTKLSNQLHTQKVLATDTGNRLIIPKMLLDVPLQEGPVRQQYALLNKGVWHWPLGSTPDKGGNTVLIGHRFTYTNPRGVFYYLNKLQTGDEIGLTWNGHKYIYRVNQIKVVKPSDTSIEMATTDERLTLFTCTPLWLPKNRLVVVAGLESKP